MWAKFQVNKQQFSIKKKYDENNYDGVVLEIYLDHKFQWLKEGLNCESLAYEAVT